MSEPSKPKPAVDLDRLPRSLGTLRHAGVVTELEMDNFVRLHHESSRRFAKAKENLQRAMGEYQRVPGDGTWKNLDVRWRLVESAAYAVAFDLANLERVKVRAAVVALAEAVDRARLDSASNSSRSGSHRHCR